AAHHRGPAQHRHRLAGAGRRLAGRAAADRGRRPRRRVPRPDGTGERVHRGPGGSGGPVRCPAVPGGRAVRGHAAGSGGAAAQADLGEGAARGRGRARVGGRAAAGRVHPGGLGGAAAGAAGRGVRGRAAAAARRGAAGPLPGDGGAACGGGGGPCRGRGGVAAVPDGRPDATAQTGRHGGTGDHRERVDTAARRLGGEPAPQRRTGARRSVRREGRVIDREQLLKDLQRQVKDLEADLREQVEALPEVRERLRTEYDQAFRLGRTAATWTVWRDERVTQAAVAWVLGTVFVRYCEDNGLLGDRVFLAGPEPARMALAEESQEEYFREHPAGTDRDWLLAAFDEIARPQSTQPEDEQAESQQPEDKRPRDKGSQAGGLLFDQDHNPLYQIPVSHDAAKALIAFWRRRGEDGALVHDFTGDDTRFLGDLYQDISEEARKRYALLQTPEFVEDFILDLTLTPAIEEFGHDVVRMIDPTCGSGHFLLGAFRRLWDEWEANTSTKDPYERVRLALDAVHGVDVNPFAVAIARFRLIVEALRKAGFRTLREAAGKEFPLHIAVGDSLLKHR